jgi:two-component system sensor histidine kinase YesM
MMTKRVKNILIWYRNLHIRSKMLLSIIALMLIPVLGIGIFSYQNSKAIIIKKTREYNTDVLSEISRNIEFTLDEISRIYYSIFTNEIVQNTLDNELTGFPNVQSSIDAKKRVENLLLEAIIDHKALQSIYIFAESGNQYNSITAGYPLSMSQKDKSLVAEAKGKMVWFDPDPNRLVIPGGRTINDLETQQRIGYMLFNFKEQGLYRIYQETNLHRLNEVFMINDSGTIISNENKQLINTKLEPDLLNQVLSGKEGFFHHMVSGKDYYIAYQEIRETGWRIVSMITAAQYEEEVISLRTRIFLIIAVSFTLSIILLVLWSNSMSKPIRNLSRMMQRVEMGTYDVRFDYPYENEMGVLSRNFNNMVERINYLIKEVYQEQLLQQRTELKYLKTQINPHFLFNTLDSIHWLAVIKGVPELGDITKKLADMLREGIKGEDFIPVEQEVQNITNYLDIQKYRFGDRMNVDIHVQLEIMKVIIPKFILQPIVENAIVHGIERKLDSGFIRIEGYMREETIYFTISDNGDGIKPENLKMLLVTSMDEDQQKNGIGLMNVDQRIKLYYGESYGVHIHSIVGEGTTVTLRLPNARPKSYLTN